MAEKEILKHQNQDLQTEVSALSRLHSVSIKLWETQDLSYGLNEILRASLELLSSNKGNIYLLNEKSLLEIIADQGFPDDFPSSFKEISPKSLNMYAQGVRFKKKVIVEDIVDSNSSELYKKLASRSHFRSVVATPLIARNGTLLGVMSLYFEDPYKSESHELKILDLYVQQAADFIERVHKNRALKKAQDQQLRLTTFLNNTFDAVMLWELKGEITYWNKGCEELYGYTKKEAIGQKTHQLLHTIHPIPFAKIEKELLTRGRWEGELIHFSKDNKDIIVDCRKVLMVDKGIPYVLETNRDVSKRVWLEKEMVYLLRANKVLAADLHYESALQNTAKLAVPEIADWCSVDMLTKKGLEQLAVVHKDPKMIAWAKKLRQQNPPDMNAKTGIAEVIHTGKSQLFSHITEEIVRKSLKSNKKIIEAAKNLHLTSAMIVPIRVSQKVVGAISFISSESGRHYTAADLSIAEELASRVGLAIENAHLYTDARNAIALRDEFISLASHELKTPITSLKMYTQSLSKLFGKEKKLFPYLQKIDRQSEKLTLLISDLLNVQTAQLGKVQYVKKPINIQDVITDAVKVVQPITKKQKIIVEGTMRKKVFADRKKIYQVLVNLLTNAIKYSAGANKIIVRLTSGKGDITVQVQDFGIGIAHSEQKKIFDEFYRVPILDLKTYPGLGMGLYVSQQIIKDHKGKLRVNSVKGKGSTFSFTIPLK